MPPPPDRRRPLPGPARRPPAPVPMDLPDDEEVDTDSSKLWVWLGVLGLGLLLIVSFEVGYRLGQPRKKSTADRPEVAANTPASTTPNAPSRAAVPTTKGGTSNPTTPKKSLTPAPVTPTAKAKPPALPPPPVITPKPPPPSEPPKSASPTYAADVRPIFEAKCVNCHGGLSKRGGLDMRTVADLVKGGNSGTALKPGNPSDSPVWKSIDDGQMPPEGKPQLTPREKQVIRDWIAAGAR